MIDKVLVLGIGNILRRDDGVGVKAIELLRQTKLLNIDLVDGGTDGLNLIDMIRPYQQAIIIDAVDMQLTPGSVKLFTLQEAKIKIKHDVLSTHGFGLAEVLGLLEKLDCKTIITIIGIQPQDISFGEELTAVVAARLSEIVELVKDIL